MTEPVRCAWSLHSPEETHYHDTEWGVPRYEDAEIFEFLTLEAAQAGLSWLTILKKREGYRRAFAGFNAATVAGFSQADVERLMLDAGIVRNRKKIESTIKNARLFLETAAEHGSFSRWIWGFVDGKPLQPNRQTMEDIPATTPLAETIAKELKRRGFSFLGPTVVYAHMQAAGMVNDHVVGCFRHAEIAALGKRGMSAGR